MRYVLAALLAIMLVQCEAFEPVCGGTATRHPDGRLECTPLP
jgi:hypothetical protein